MNRQAFIHRDPPRSNVFEPRGETLSHTFLLLSRPIAVHHWPQCVVFDATGPRAAFSQSAWASTFADGSPPGSSDRPAMSALP
ncbi:hypothetical protein LJ656_22410 [Paraburkholderia sp. MMS20-SJTR3]|uniref:Uncharacterized protein n=1 Tax=Paraburkholderia sejongensis TaxID=2886946 RepID=A0ABS8JZK9_9BURK|nr:hypothetical protein [Paraburkholderia sp. MMS20-SJTR3]MCC8395346.1 hypothetical protein [Paraburkholderia sp. MMS20-SJTR3]